MTDHDTSEAALHAAEEALEAHKREDQERLKAKAELETRVAEARRAVGHPHPQVVMQDHIRRQHEHRMAQAGARQGRYAAVASS